MSGIKDNGNIIRNELRVACSHELNRLLLGSVKKSENDAMDQMVLLSRMKKLSVQGVHKEVHRRMFFQMQQQEGEPMTHFVARLNSLAKLCEFNVPCQSTSCDCSVSYSEEMVSNQMVGGLYNSEHQMKLLAEAASLQTFQEKFDRLVSLETTDKSLPHLTPASKSAVTKSSYQRSKYQQGDKAGQEKKIGEKKGEEKKTCVGCGRTHHNGKTMERHNCPAWGKKCHNCDGENHFAIVCKRSKNIQHEKSRNRLAKEDTSDDESQSDAAFFL